MGKFLSLTGLTTLVSKMKSYFVPQTRTVNGKALSANITLTGGDMTVSSTDSTTVASKLGTLATEVAGKADVNSSTGKIDASLLPSYVNDVLEYAGSSDLSGKTISTGAASSPTSIVFNTATKKFVAFQTSDSAGATVYFASWGGTSNVELSTSWGDASDTGVSPQKGKIYVDTSSNKVYRWGGSAMVEVSPDVAYTLPQATASALGGVKIGYTESGKNYAVQLDSNGKAYVNVPWSNTGGVADSVAWGDVTGVPDIVTAITNEKRVLTKLTTGTNAIIAQGYNGKTGVEDTVELKTVQGESIIGSGGISIAEATTTAAGLMSKYDKALLEAYKTVGGSPEEITSISAAASKVTINTNYYSLDDGSTGTSTHDIPAATTSAAGVMTASDKAKLDDFEGEITTEEITALFA